MALTKIDHPNKVVYTTTEGTIITIQKKGTVIDVQQVTPLSESGGQTWQSLRDYLDTKLGLP